MNRSWTFTDIEFAAAWDRTKEEHLPPPFVYLSSTKYHDDHVREKAAAWQRVRSNYGPDLEEVLADIAAPDIRIVVRGFDGENQEDPERSVRILAARKAGNGYVVTQKPGKTIWHSGGFTISEHNALALGDVVAEALPEAPAGRRGTFPLVTSSGTGGGGVPGSSSVLHSDKTSGTTLEAFTSEPAERTGSITVQQGYSVFGPRGVFSRRMEWRDIVDDGRYVIVPGETTMVLPADRSRLVGVINRAVADAVRVIRDERASARG